MADRIRDMLNDFNAGKISVGTLTHQLEFLASIEENRQSRKENRTRNVLDNYMYEKSPEDILCERERMTGIADMVQQIKDNLTNDQWNIFFDHVVNGVSQGRIAERYGVSQPAIYATLERIYSKCREMFGAEERDLLLAKTSMLCAGSPKDKLKYPSDNAMSNTEKSRNGRMKVVCKMTEYLDGCFGDNQTACFYCSTCSNKEMARRRTYDEV